MTDSEQDRPIDDPDAETLERDPAEQDGREAATPQEPSDPAERVMRATPQRGWHEPMIRQPKDTL